MSVRFEDILSALCSRVELRHANEFQNIFLLDDAKEAGLACDVLLAHGFDAKVYTEENASKLYVTLPEPDAGMEKKLAGALAYAVSLKAIKLNLDSLCNDGSAASGYTIAFANTPPGGSQVMIQFSSAASPSTAAEPVSRSQTTQAQTPPAVGQARKTPGAKNRWAAAPKDDQSFFYGPLVGKQLHKRNHKAPPRPDSLWQITGNYIGGHMEALMYGAVMAVILMVILLSLFTFLRSFLCPDFAKVHKNHAWYCESLFNDSQ